MAERGRRWLSLLRWAVLASSMGVATAMGARATLATTLRDHPMWSEILLHEFFEDERWQNLQDVVYFDEEGLPEQYNTAWMGVRRGVAICASHWNELRYQLVEQIERVGAILVHLPVHLSGVPDPLGAGYGTVSGLAANNPGKVLDTEAGSLE